MVDRTRLERDPQLVSAKGLPPGADVAQHRYPKVSAAPRSTVTGMELTQMQVEAISAASGEGPVDPGSFARVLLLDDRAAVEAFTALEQRGLMRRDDDGCFFLTEDGEELQRRWEAQKSAAVKRRTGTWQPR